MTWVPAMSQPQVLSGREIVRTGLKVDVPGHLVVVGALREVLEGSSALLATGDDRAVCCQQLLACVYCVGNRERDAKSTCRK